MKVILPEVHLQFCPALQNISDSLNSMSIFSTTFIIPNLITNQQKDCGSLEFATFIFINACTVLYTHKDKNLMKAQLLKTKFYEPPVVYAILSFCGQKSEKNDYCTLIIFVRLSS